MIAEGITPRQTKFETNKEKLRQTIRTALSAATSFEDFSSLLLREGVTEALKAADQMAWVRSMNSIHNSAEEIVLAELVYC